MRHPWHSDFVQLIFDYSMLNRTISENLTACLPRLDPFDPIAVTLRARLTDMSADAAAAERRALTSAYEISEQWDVVEGAAEKIHQRLAELDPSKYPLDYSGASAKR
jgi:hypothetical protein